MKQTVSETMFTEAFQSIRPDNFTYDGLRALYDYLEELSEDCGTEYELDVIALCCEFSEHSDVIEVACRYFTFEGMTYDEEGAELETVEDVEEKALNYLQDHTTVITFNGGIIIQDF